MPRLKRSALNMEKWRTQQRLSLQRTFLRPLRVKASGASRYARAFFSQQEKAIDKEKSANGVAPNCVRACDAAHLLLVANAAAVEGVRQIATVHDSFGCLASHARRFNQVILEQFALMDQTHGVLAELLEQASHDLTPSNQNRLFSRELRPRHDHPGQGADFRRRGAALR